MNAKDIGGWTPIWNACINGQKYVIEWDFLGNYSTLCEVVHYLASVANELWFFPYRQDKFFVYAEWFKGVSKPNGSHRKNEAIFLKIKCEE